MKKAESFIKQFVAFIKGDDAEVMAQKALRQAKSAITAHIAIGNNETLAKEDAVEAAKELLEAARVNHGNLITDRDKYVIELLLAKNAVIEAEEELAAHLEKLAFLNEELEKL